MNYSEKDAMKCETAMGRSSEVPLKLQETDLSSLSSTITYPSGKVMPCSIKRLEDGQIGGCRSIFYFFWTAYNFIN